MGWRLDVYRYLVTLFLKVLSAALCRTGPVLLSFPTCKTTETTCSLGSVNVCPTHHPHPCFFTPTPLGYIFLQSSHMPPGSSGTLGYLKNHVPSGREMCPMSIRGGTHRESTTFRETSTSCRLQVHVGCGGWLVPSILRGGRH